MTATLWILVGIVGIAWVAFWMAVVPAATREIRRRLALRLGDTPAAGFLDLINVGYVGWWHRLRLIGFEDLPAPFREGDRGAGIVVANHAAGIDPLMVQAGIRRFIRWMMWAGMMTPVLAPVWKTGRILPVRYGSQDSSIVRTAVRHLKDGGLIGIFAEGAIARPPGEIRPFQAGVGLVARLSKAPVLLLHIHGAPYTPTAFGSIFRRSHTVVEVVGIFDLKDVKDPHEAADRLREALVAHCGWPTNEESMIDRSEIENSQDENQW